VSFTCIIVRRKNRVTKLAFIYRMGMVDQGDGSVGVIGVFPMNFIKLDDEYVG
jgi:hypothetical protein